METTKEVLQAKVNAAEGVVYMALELSALYAERAGRRADAIQILTDLEKDTSAPQGVRGRAKELLAILGKS